MATAEMNIYFMSENDFMSILCVGKATTKAILELRSSVPVITQQQLCDIHQLENNSAFWDTVSLDIPQDRITQVPQSELSHVDVNVQIDGTTQWPLGPPILTHLLLKPLQKMAI